MNERTTVEVRAVYRRSLWATLIVLVSFSAVWTWLMLLAVSLDHPTMRIADVRYEAVTLCPGETLTYSYGVEISEPGVYVFDASVWDMNQRRVVLFGNELRLVAASPQKTRLVRHWVLPEQYYDTLTDTWAAWSPGRYERHIAVTAAGRDTLPSMAAIPFVVRADCE